MGDSAESPAAAFAGPADARSAPACRSPPIPAAVIADRARAAAIFEATTAGAEAERDEAIHTGACVEEFRRSLGTFTILRAMGKARGV